MQNEFKESTTMKTFLQQIVLIKCMNQYKFDDLLVIISRKLFKALELFNFQ